MELKLQLDNRQAARQSGCYLAHLSLNQIRGLFKPLISKNAGIRG